MTDKKQSVNQSPSQNKKPVKSSTFEKRGEVSSVADKPPKKK